MASHRSNSLDSLSPTLPTELIDEILRSDDLSNADLARCCLVSHQFLPSARKSLYNILTMRIITFYCRDSTRYAYDEPSFQLLLTLRRRLTLSKLCIGLRIRDDAYGYSYDPRKQSGPPAEAVKDWLDLCPNARMLSAPEIPEYGSSYPMEALAHRGDWIALSLTHREGSTFFNQWSTFPHLKKLECIDYAGGQMFVPDSTITLRISQNSRASDEPVTLVARPPSPLQNLSVPLKLLKTIDLPNFPHLTYLALHDVQYAVDRCFAPLANLTKLRRLSLDSHSFESVPRSLSSFLLCDIPPSLSRLDFPNQVPFNYLCVSVLNPRLRTSISRLGLSDETEQSQLKVAARLCMEKGIELLYMRSNEKSWTGRLTATVDPIFGI